VNYREALAWLYGTQVFGIKLGLDNTRCLFAALGDPAAKLRFLHVAGTNGKGSTCAMLEGMLREAGLRCGLYTSPHLVDFRERIRISSELISEEAVAEGLTRLRDASAGWDHAPTFFELATALAAWWFAEQAAEAVVWETGMGGRLDATNVVVPEVSVITPVGLDHQKFLGHTLAEIAWEKAGIIKQGVPVVMAPQTDEARRVIESRAAELGSLLIAVEKPWEAGPLGLVGAHQRWNAAVALAALDASGFSVDKVARARGLAGVVWPARFQRAGSNLVIDGAHNPAAVEALVATWREVFGGCKARLVFGALQDKDAAELLRLLRVISDQVWLVPVANERGADVAELAVAARSAGFSEVRCLQVGEALDEARRGGGPVLVAGSLFLAGEVLERCGGDLG
jgi:dihydrofolate synthase / folylpolyglutamate synthase